MACRRLDVVFLYRVEMDGTGRDAMVGDMANGLPVSNDGAAESVSRFCALSLGRRHLLHL